VGAARQKDRPNSGRYGDLGISTGAPSRRSRGGPISFEQLLHERSATSAFGAGLLLYFTDIRASVNDRFAPEIGIGGRLATPPLPHHRATGPYHGGSIELGLHRHEDSGETKRVEDVIS
jgi:hypothetical protein